MRAVAALPEDDGPDLEAGLSRRVLELIASLDGSASAPFLFSDEKIGGVGAKAGAHFTARYLKERQPRIYRACVALCGAGYSLREVAELLTISKNTVAAVIDDAPELLGTLKQRTAGLLRRAGLKMAEIIDERASEIPIGQLAVSLGIVTQNAQLLEGEATAIIERTNKASHSDWSETLAALEAEFGPTGSLVGETDKRESLSEADVSLLESARLTADTESPAACGLHTDAGLGAGAFACASTASSPADPLNDDLGGEGVEPSDSPKPAH